METPELKRSEFFKATAAAGAAAVLASAGFNRTAQAAHHETITQLAKFGYKPEKKDVAAE